jgi:hypothetical protein
VEEGRERERRDLAADDEPAVVLGAVLGDLLEGEHLGRRRHLLVSEEEQRGR